MPLSTPETAAKAISQAAAAFMTSPDNDMHMPEGPEPAFGQPLIGFAAGDDALWASFKEHVGLFHWTPEEAFGLGVPEAGARADELTVISWILPHTERTRADNRKQRDLPAERWARARIFGEEYVNNGLRRHLLAAFAAWGVQAVSPMLLTAWQRMDSEKFVYASTWSERHAAFAAGLGTFGLCDGLITPVGKAMRAGSVIVRLRVAPTERLYTHHQEYCLFFSSGTCGACIRRCPAKALSEQGHDKVACKNFLRNVTAPHVETTWHFTGYGCGFCQVGVPCEKGIPPKARAARLSLKKD